MISQREIWLKQETVIIERVTRYVSIDKRGDRIEMLETDRMIEDVANTKSKGDKGGGGGLAHTGEGGKEFARRKRREYQ